LQILPTKEKEALNSTRELGVCKEGLQSGTQDELQVLRTYCTELEEEKNFLTEECDALRTERDLWKADYDGIKSMHNALTDELNAFTEKHNSLQSGINTLIESTVEVILKKFYSIQEAYLTSSKERETMRLEHGELKVKLEELEREYTTLKEDSSTIRGERDALQRDKERLEDGMEKMLNQHSGVQTSLLEVIEERDTLKLQQEELKAHLERLETECGTLKNDLNTITEKCNTLQNDKIAHLEVGMRKKMTEISNIQKAHLAVNQENDGLESEYNEWKVNFEKLERECSTLNENLNVTREKCDGLHKDTCKLVHMESGIKKILAELPAIQKALFIEAQASKTLRSEQAEMKRHLKEMETECSTLEEDLSAISEDCDALQKEKNKLVHMEAVMRKKMDELLANQKAQVAMTQDREALRSEQDESNVNSEEREKDCTALKDNLNVARGNYDPLLKDNHELVGIKKLLNEISCNQKALLAVSLEKKISSSEHDELKLHLDELEKECSTIKQYLNIIVGKCDALQNDKHKIIYLRKKLDELLTIQKSRLSVTEERGTLKSEPNKLKANFEEPERECSAQNDNSNATKEKRESLQDKSNLVHREGEIEMMNELQDNEMTLAVIQERDTLRSKQEELNINSGELERECGILKNNLNIIRKERDALWKDKDKLVRLEGGMERIMNEMLAVQKVFLAATQEKEQLRTDNEEMKVSAIAITGGGDALQKDEEKLVLLECGNRKMFDEISGFQKAIIAVSQERETLRLKHQELKVNSEEFERVCTTLNENLNVIRKRCDAILKHNDGLVQLRDSTKKLLEELWGSQMVFLAVIQERDSLKLKYEEFKTNTTELEKECTTLKDNFNDIREKCDALQKSKDKLVQLDGGIKRMLNELLATEKAFLAVTQERDTLRLEHEELKARFEELEAECVTLKKDLIPIRQGGDALQKDKDKLVQLECGMKKMFDELTGIQKALFAVTQERDVLRSQHEELKVNTETLERECNSLKNNISDMRQSCDVLQNDRVKIMDLEGELRKKLGEVSSIRKAYLLVTEERNTLRLEHNELKFNFEELLIKCSSLKDDLDVVRGKCDELEKIKHSLIERLL
jgi:chromosome segregation ATPase